MKIEYNVKTENGHENKMTVDLYDDTDPKYAAKYVLDDLEHWNKQSLDNLHSINIIMD